MQIGALDQVLTGEHEALRWDRHHTLAAALGLDGVELGVGVNYAQTQLWSAAGRRALLAQSQAQGVATASLCLHGYWQLSLASDDEGIRAQGVCLGQEACGIAAELGASHLLVPLTCPPGVADALARERWVAGMRQCAPAAEESGVVLCLENVGRAFANAHEDVAAIIDAVGSSAVQAYYDPGNAVHYGTDPLAGVTVLGQRIAQVHVKEMGGTLLGEGQVPWPAILAALRAGGYDGWLVFETEPTADPAAAAARNLATLRGWLVAIV
ncbi:MAG: sugar phosphate isomerase/epimerase [Chloroflexi bacterium]|nr:sugar phosphate isomerase/epimerase [Chloroflexota bacterium]